MRLRGPFEVAGMLLDLGFSTARNDTAQPEPVKPEPLQCGSRLSDLCTDVTELLVRCRKPSGHMDAHEWRGMVDVVKWTNHLGEEGADP